jgi:hypothetical protein
MHRFHRAGASQQVTKIVPAGSRHRATGRPVPGRPGRPPRWRPARPPAGLGRPSWPTGYSASWPGRAGSHPVGLSGPYAALADVVRGRAYSNSSRSRPAREQWNAHRRQRTGSWPPAIEAVCGAIAGERSSAAQLRPALTAGRSCPRLRIRWPARACQAPSARAVCAPTIPSVTRLW